MIKSYKEYIDNYVTSFAMNTCNEIINDLRKLMLNVDSSGHVYDPIYEDGSIEEFINKHITTLDLNNDNDVDFLNGFSNDVRHRIKARAIDDASAYFIAEVESENE